MGIDLRDLWRPGSGMTMRRLLVLIWGLPRDSITHQLRVEAEQKALIPTADKIRERQEHYRRMRERATKSDSEGGV